MEAATGLSGLPDGDFVTTASGSGTSTFTITRSGVTTEHPNTIPARAQPAAGTSDFLPLASGDILLIASDNTLPIDPSTGEVTTALYRLHADGTFTEIGTLPGVIGSGLAASGGQLFFTGVNSLLARLDGPLPTASSTAPLPFTAIATVPSDHPLWSATSTQDATCPLDDIPLPLIGNPAVAGLTAAVLAMAALAVAVTRRRISDPI